MLILWDINPCTRMGFWSHGVRKSRSGTSVCTCRDARYPSGSSGHHLRWSAVHVFFLRVHSKVFLCGEGSHRAAGLKTPTPFHTLICTSSPLRTETAYLALCLQPSIKMSCTLWHHVKKEKKKGWFVQIWRLLFTLLGKSIALVSS